MKQTVLTLVFFTLTLLAGFSQTIDGAKLDSYFQALETNQKFMGSVAISENGKVVYTQSIGFADVEKQTKPSATTRYRIGSISKTFTTTLVFKAIEEKKLKLTDKIDTWCPTIPNAAKITIGQLLSHRSGIHNFTDNEDYLKWNTQKKTEKELTDIIAKGGSDFEPDSKASYSNSNFVLLTFILQKVYNKDFEKLLTEKIIKPVGLKNTIVGKTINPAGNEAYSYKFASSWTREPETDMSIPLGAGALVSTPSDLTQFAEALFSGKIISSESVKQMTTIRDTYGMGLFQIPFYERIGYGHTGGIDGFTSVFAYFPQDKTTFALTSNGSNYVNNNIMIALLSAFYNKPYEIPTFTNYEVKPEELDSYLGVYASKAIPLKITITKSDKQLMAQATGQSAFPLEAAAKDKFKFDQAGIVLEFNPAAKTMLLKQGGQEFTFTKE